MVVVQDNQTLFDIAILNDGTVDSALDWAVFNGLSLTEDIAPGQILQNPNSVYRNQEKANFFKYRNQNLGTAIKASNNNLKYGFPYGFPIAL